MQRLRTGTALRERVLRLLRHRSRPDRRPTNGLLKTAAIVQIVEGGLAAIFGLWLLSATTSDVGGWLAVISGIGQLGNDGAAGTLIIAAATLGFAIAGFRRHQLER